MPARGEKGRGPQTTKKECPACVREKNPKTMWDSRGIIGHVGKSHPAEFDQFALDGILGKKTKQAVIDRWVREGKRLPWQTGIATSIPKPIPATDDHFSFEAVASQLDYHLQEIQRLIVAIKQQRLALAG